jgi:integrase/recombinase XerC
MKHMPSKLIDRYMDELAERGCTTATLTEYRKNLSRADRELPFGLDEANAVELRAWIWHNNLSMASRRTYDAALRSYFAWRETAGLLEWNPMSRLKPPKVPEGLPRVARDDQVRWAVHECPDPLRLWAVLGAYAGLRCIEISRLDRGHVTEEVIAVHRGKGDRARLVPTHQIVWACVKDLPPGPITECTPKEVSLRFKRFCLRCGIRDLSMHRLRGWMATNAYNATKDPRAVQMILGHTNLATTTRYIASDLPHQKAAVAGLPAFFADIHAYTHGIPSPQ